MRLCHRRNKVKANQQVGGPREEIGVGATSVSYTHLRAHETVLDLVCRLLLEKKKNKNSDILEATYTSQLTVITSDLAVASAVIEQRKRKAKT